MTDSTPAATAAGWPINWNCAPVAPFVGVRRWLNIWRLRYVIDGGVYVEFYRTRKRVIVTRVTGRIV